jgi:hypothetical protein
MVAFTEMMSPARNPAWLPAHALWLCLQVYGSSERPIEASSSEAPNLGTPPKRHVALHAVLDLNLVGPSQIDLRARQRLPRLRLDKRGEEKGNTRLSRKRAMAFV